MQKSGRRAARRKELGGRPPGEKSSMGCNASNHSSDCNCGFGGDTAWARATAGGVRHPTVIDGHTWRLDRQPSLGAYLNPNATCPVCGKPVYFYRSSWGGRVFFDDLGPPWPKHGCTDNSDAMIVGPASAPMVFSRDFRPTAWHPLRPGNLTNYGGYDCLKVPEGEGFPTGRLFVPSGWVGDAPSLWRWKSDDRTRIEVSCVRVDAGGSVETRIFVMPSWLCSPADLEAWLLDPEAEPSPEKLNSIGFAHSFAWRLEGIDLWALWFKAVDMQAARLLFERSAASGYWAATNNLAVMYEHGWGVPIDKTKAFELYHQAAQSLEDVPVGHLARCYREGIGCKRNEAEAKIIEERRASR